MHSETGDQIVYVNDGGSIVQQAGTTVVEKQASAAQEAVVTYDQIQQNLPRYELLEKKGRKEIYRDRRTGQKVTVNREKD